MAQACHYATLTYSTNLEAHLTAGPTANPLPLMNTRSSSSSYGGPSSYGGSQSRAIYFPGTGSYGGGDMYGYNPNYGYGSHGHGGYRKLRKTQRAVVEEKDETAESPQSLEKSKEEAEST